jgi:hypothetical protein
MQGSLYDQSLDQLTEESVMLDPSIFLSHRYLEVRQCVLSGECGKIYIPASLKRAFDEPHVAMSRFFPFRLEPEVYRQAIEDMSETEFLVPFAADLKAEVANSEFLYALQHQYPSRGVADVLFEEWVFLQSNSMIVSRSKRSFGPFVHAGAAMLEFGRGSFDILVSKTLKLSNKRMPRALTSGQRLRAVSKWVAVGGPAVASVINPTFEIIGTVAAGFFLLIDP